MLKLNRLTKFHYAVYLKHYKNPFRVYKNTFNAPIYCINRKCWYSFKNIFKIVQSWIKVCLPSFRINFWYKIKHFFLTSALLWTHLSLSSSIYRAAARQSGLPCHRRSKRLRGTERGQESAQGTTASVDDLTTAQAAHNCHSEEKQTWRWTEPIWTD